MPAAVIYNDIIRKSQTYSYVMQVLYTDSNLAYDVSDWEFRYIMTDMAGNVIWDVENADITRVSNSKISVDKDLAEVQALTEDAYNWALYVTAPELGVTNQIWMKGVNTTEA